MLISYSISWEPLNAFVKLFTSGYKGKGQQQPAIRNERDYD